MFEFIARVWNNFDFFILNHPSMDCTNATEKRKCDYCGAEHGWTHYVKSGMTICQECHKKAMDRILKKKN